MNEQLIRQIERAVRAGRVVTVGDLTIRYCKSGQEFSDDSQHFLPHVTGVFLRMNVFRGRDAYRGTPAGTTWGYYASLGDLDAVMKAPLERLTALERGALAADLALTAGIGSIRADYARRRSGGPATGEHDGGCAPASGGR